MLIREKVDQAIGILNEFDIDCWITFVRESQINGDPMLPFLTASGITWHSAFILSKDGGTCAIVGRYDVASVRETGAYDRVVGFVEGVKAPFHDAMLELDPKQIALNYSEGSEICDGLTHGMYLTMVRLLEEIGMADRIISAERCVSAIRERKTPSELASMQEAVRHTEEIFDLVAGFIQAGVTEAEIAGFMSAEVGRRNLEPAWEAAHCPAVFTGPDTAEAHYGPSGKVVEKGHVLNMDFGVKVDGYCSDMQRTFYILQDGETGAPTDVQHGFDTIVRSVHDAFKAMAPGRLGHEIDKVARDVVTFAGYEEFPHGLGHQVGRFSHDGTALLGPPWEKYAEKPFQPLEANMVFTIEPRLTIPGRGICTIEEMAVITDEGAEFLSHPQTEIILI
jgi:Xaa-Pro aminopeptidase